ncbi:hypothetical protein BS329_30645 [Amycolatopsis coloradensis]|uniref:Uncharacterized protein n=1 Tax=Amycolatopsis coloradensis TaxID=76021 RepID=A0A1R0KJ20_9PSEU|nr:hypothetical protein [Amycolatopsis coloradensis]OLZ46040.1 hypothetical protein BS329_30645 [Amycolatopsis coloradensis]
MTWWQIGVTALVGILATSGAFLGARLGVRANDRATEQRERAARREEWWRRFTWAAELALDESAVKRTAGLSLMMKLARSELAEQDEYRLLDVFHQRVLGDILNSAEKTGQGE